MAKFIKCLCDVTQYKGNEIKNNPINIDLVTQVEKIQEKYYPDNEGIPAIKFHGINKVWCYDRNKSHIRDEDFEKIINDKNN